jgi:hypothetical protein
LPGRSLDRPNIVGHRYVVAFVVTAPQSSTAQASHSSFDPAEARPVATPLYDALVHEYRLALRWVPGDQNTDGRSSGIGSAPRPDVEFNTPYPRRTGGVPRQVSRHRGISGDSPGQVY